MPLIEIFFKAGSKMTVEIKNRENKMNKVKNVILGVFLTVGVIGFANASTDDYSNVKFDDYSYGMNLDVKKVLSMSQKAGNCETVPAKMVYENSKGEIKGLTYQVLSEGCDDH